MPPRKKTSRAKSQKGRGVAKDIASAVHSIVKNNRLVSRGLGLTPLAPLAPVARMLGYGKKKKSTRKRKSTTRAPKKLKIGLSGKARVPRSATRSRSRTVLAPVGQVGRGFFSDLGGGIGNVFGGLGGGIGSVARGMFGGSKGSLGGKAGRQIIGIY